MGKRVNSCVSQIPCFKMQQERNLMRTSAGLAGLHSPLLPVRAALQRTLSLDCPMKRPFAVRAFRAALGAPSVLVGRRSVSAEGSMSISSDVLRKLLESLGMNPGIPATQDTLKVAVKDFGSAQHSVPRRRSCICCSSVISLAPEKLLEDDCATHWVTVGPVQEKVGVSVDRS
jgi:hypothetical protein